MLDRFVCRLDNLGDKISFQATCSDCPNSFVYYFLLIFRIFYKVRAAAFRFFSEQFVADDWDIPCLDNISILILSPAQVASLS